MLGNPTVRSSISAESGSLGLLLSHIKVVVLRDGSDLISAPAVRLQQRKLQSVHLQCTTPTPMKHCTAITAVEEYLLGVISSTNGLLASYLRQLHAIEWHSH